MLIDGEMYVNTTFVDLFETTSLGEGGEDLRVNHTSIGFIVISMRMCMDLCPAKLSSHISCGQFTLTVKCLSLSKREKEKKKNSADFGFK